MKQLTKLALTAAMLLFCSSAFAQKFGYINSNELITLMPEHKEAMDKLKQYDEELNSQLEAIEVEFNKKYEDYQKNSATYTDVIRQAKESELTEINQRYEQNRTKMTQDFQAMQQQLMQPIGEKAQSAISEVSKENGFTIVFDVTIGAMLYYDESTVVNVMPLVKTKLGIQ